VFPRRHVEPPLTDHEASAVIAQIPPFMVLAMKIAAWAPVRLGTVLPLVRTTRSDGVIELTNASGSLVLPVGTELFATVARLAPGDGTSPFRDRQGRPCSVRYLEQTVAATAARVGVHRPVGAGNLMVWLRRKGPETRDVDLSRRWYPGVLLSLPVDGMGGPPLGAGEKPSAREAVTDIIRAELTRYVSEVVRQQAPLGRWSPR
jgi:hypothetical protein